MIEWSKYVYVGGCVACLRPTDTVLAAEGERRWHVAFLVKLGAMESEATALALLRCDAERPDAAIYYVCRRCTMRAGFPLPVRAIDGMPVPVVVGRGR